MADSIRFSEAKQGDTFEYNGSHFRKVSHTHAADAMDDSIGYPMSGDTLVTPIDDPKAEQVESEKNRLYDDVKPLQFPVATPVPAAEAATAGEDGLEELTVDQLKELADENEVEYRSDARKADLVAALREANVAAPETEDDEE